MCKSCFDQVVKHGMTVKKLPKTAGNKYILHPNHDL